ncbi:MAG: VIT domain-containing protein [Candidatus Kapabacteria bacterium]|nr:VIT domain-containing protein [Candidatus Kapabacteria bacterium]
MSFSARFLIGLVTFAFMHFSSFSANNLTVLDPQAQWRFSRGTIEQFDVTIKPNGIYAEVGLYITFSSRGSSLTKPSDTLEVVFQFDLPQDAILNDSWLWIENIPVKALLLDKWTASQIYEGIVKRRKDPSILTKINQTSYELRVFPMAGNETRKVKINYLVPINWTLSNTFAYLEIPLKLMKLSLSAPKSNLIAFYENIEFNDPKISEDTTIIFKDIEHQEYGKCKLAEINPQISMNYSNVRFSNPMKNGIYFNYSEKSPDNYYQLAVLPSQALEFKNPQKILILLDFDKSKSDQKPEEILNTIKTTLQMNFTEADSFNLMLSSLSIHPVSPDWLPAEKSIIENTFNSLPYNALTTYSNLPTLLYEGTKYAKTKGDGATILLLSNSDMYGSLDVANQIIADLKKYTSNKNPIHIYDYINKNQINYYINNRNYFGNEYLYFNLSKQTGGNYVRYSSGKTVLQFISNAFLSLNGYINNFEFYTSMENGFCYARYFINNSNQSVNYSSPIVEIGKFYGEMPLNITASGFYKDKPFSKKIHINQNDFLNPDYLNNIIWNGNYIKYMETSKQQTNEIITEIIQTSLDNRILSLYTAFLCLETIPSDTINYQGEKDVLTYIYNNNLTDFDVQASPNPFNYSTNLIITKKSSEDEILSIKIYDIMGNAVKTFDTGQYFSSGKISLSWSGESESGEKLPDGAYILVISTKRGSKILKLILLR